MATTNQARSTDYRLPLWLRLTALAVEEMDLDAHTATFGPGEVRELLAQGEQLHYSAVTKAIGLAVDHGLLLKGSSTRCLRVIPGSLTTGPAR